MVASLPTDCRLMLLLLHMPLQMLLLTKSACIDILLALLILPPMLRNKWLEASA